MLNTRAWCIPGTQYIFAVKSVARSQLIVLDHWSSKPEPWHRGWSPELRILSPGTLLCPTVAEAVGAHEASSGGEGSFLKSFRSIQLVALLLDHRRPGGNAEERARTGRSKEKTSPDPPTAV